MNACKILAFCRVWAATIWLILRKHDRGRARALRQRRPRYGPTSNIKFPFTDPGYGELGGHCPPLRFRPETASGSFRSETRISGSSKMTIERYIPHVIEPASRFDPRRSGAHAGDRPTRSMKTARQRHVPMNFTPAMAPKKAAILPLTAKDRNTPNPATKLYLWSCARNSPSIWISNKISANAMPDRMKSAHPSALPLTTRPTQTRPSPCATAIPWHKNASDWIR